MFPELALCGYWPADLLEKQAFVARAEQALREVQAWTSPRNRPAILVGTVLATDTCEEGKGLRNVAVLLQYGEVKLIQAKMLLPFYDVFDEQRYFEPAVSQSFAIVEGSTSQLVAISICEDAWNDKGFWPRRGRHRTH